jgi:phosphoserine phosphatase
MRVRASVKFILITFSILVSCREQDNFRSSKEYLKSWSDGKVKNDIIKFVESVTNESSLEFVPPAERIATFDNDGTLWAEKPVYVQVKFAMDRVKEMSKTDKSLRQKQPFKAIIENDAEYLSKLGSHDLMEAFTVTHSNMSNTEFHKIAHAWLDTAKHPTFNKHYTSMVYQPMLELLEYLRDNEFKTYICSGGGIEFIRVFSEDIYGIPPENVIGTSYKLEFVNNDNKISLNRTPVVNSFNDKQEKALNIQLHIGRKPLIAVGNSNGDLQMLQFSADNDRPSLQILLHHDDKEREWAYDRDSKIGHLDIALDEAMARNWIVISMKNDWQLIFDTQ